MEKLLQQQKSLRLVVVAKNANPPYVTKIMDRFYFKGDCSDKLFITSGGVSHLHYLPRQHHAIENLSIHWIFYADMSTLITAWTIYLTKLTLTNVPSKGMEKTWKTIDSLPFLKSLNLCSMYGVAIPNDFTALERLEEFSLSGYNASLVPVLSKLGSSLKHLSLDFVCLNEMDLYNVMGNNAKFGENIVHFTLGEIMVPINPEQNFGFNSVSSAKYKEFFGLFSTKMANLNRLDLNCAADVSQSPSI